MGGLGIERGLCYACACAWIEILHGIVNARSSIGNDGALRNGGVPLRTIIGRLIGRNLEIVRCECRQAE